MNLRRISCVPTLLATILFAICALAGDKETSLYNFNGSLNTTSNAGEFPHGLLLYQGGNLYGATVQGARGAVWGTIFELTPNGSGGWNFNLVYDCSEICESPIGSLVTDAAGNLYGVAAVSSAVFEISPDGSGGWTAIPLHNFNGGTDGDSPNPGLVLDAAGNLYGTNYYGGADGLGYVFELSPGSGGYWTLTHLHDFTGSDGASPGVTVTMDAAGNLYGTTEAGGGSTQCTSGCGVAFKLTNSGGVWTETVLHAFKGPEGSNLQGTLTMDTAGNLYGTAIAGGAAGAGVVFEISPTSGGWKTRDLYAFKSGAADGAAPYENLLLDASGNLYGTTWSGGGGDCSVLTDAGCGTAFKLTHNGTNWSDSILHDFTGRGDGAFPEGIIFGPDGVLYGVAPAGGGLEGGLVYELTPPAAPKR